MRILFISDPYPNNKHPNKGTFVYNFVQQLIALGNEVTVITPSQFSPFDIFKKDMSYGEDQARVFRPTVFTASARKILFFHTYSISRIQKVKAVKRIVKEHHIEFDIVYCHFIQSAMFAVEALRAYDKPFFVAVGENNSIQITKRWYSKRDYYEYLSYVNGFVAVSDVVKQKLIQINGVDPSRILVARNGTGLARFNKVGKTEARKELGFDLNQFLVVFIGRFVESKGPLRVIEATKDIENTGLVMVGSGPQKLNSPQIVFNNKVTKAVVPTLLASADVFVLPTLHEGSNNAIVEAMASGLPIISSDIPEIREQVTNELAILVNPNDVDAIGDAIKRIKNNPDLQKTMAEASLKHSRNFDIEVRAKKIVDFIKKKMP